MKRIKDRLLKLRIWRDTGGQDLVEYALAAGLVAVAAVACMPGLSGTVNNVFTKIGSIINTSVTTGS
jgi:pilus assembly protein Flp/PilA